MKNYDYENSPQGFSNSGQNKNVNYRYLFDLLSTLLDKKVTVLEVGCGGGRNLKAIKEKFKDSVSVFGTDISFSAIKYAKSLNIGTFSVAPSYKIPFQSSFNLILLIDILEHLSSVQEAKQTIGSLLDKLESGGYLYVSIPTELRTGTLTWAFSKAPFFRDLTLNFFGHTIQFSETDVLDLLSNYNATVVDKFYSAHVITQIRMLLFFFVPKVLIQFLFGKEMLLRTRDSNEIISGGPSPLGVVKTLLTKIAEPLDWLACMESKVSRRSPALSNNLHLLIRKK